MRRKTPITCFLKSMLKRKTPIRRQDPLQFLMLEDRVTPSNFDVTSSANAGSGTLREAVFLANTLPGADTVTFTIPGVVFLTSEIAITDNITISGNNFAPTISGSGTNRIFNTDGGTSSTVVTISGLSLTSASSTDGGAVNIGDEIVNFNDCFFNFNTSSGDGGAINIQSGGTLNLTRCSLTGNTAASSGGAIYFNVGGSGKFIDSAIVGNKATGTGGGLYFFGNVTAGGLTVRNTTISGNSSGASGGGIVLPNLNGTLLVQNSTIVNNTADTLGGGIVRPNGSGTITLVSSIVSGNVNAAAPDISSIDFVNVNYSAVGSNLGFSLSGSSGNNLAFGTDLKLRSLKYNGGYAPSTHAFEYNSPLRNAGSNPAGLTTDQRGAYRDDGGIDIGAFELNTLVTNTNDGGVGSLRNAVNESNLVVGTDTITFDSSFNSPQIVQVFSSELSLTDAASIVGVSANLTTLRGNGFHRIFNLSGAPASSFFNISGLTISGGASADGAGIFLSKQNLLLSYCSVVDNIGNTQGGGIYMNDTGSLSIFNCTIANNISYLGAGINVSNQGGLLAIVDSTVTGNTAYYSGGGVYFMGPGGSGDFVRNSTITKNTAGVFGGAGGGIFHNSSLPMDIISSVVSGNSSPVAPDISNFVGTVNVTTSAIGSVSGWTFGTGSGNLSPGIDLKLGPLANNSGPTLTHLPAVDSPLRGKGSNPGGLLVDQRSLPRTDGVGNVDIGAVQVNTTSVVSITRNNSTPTSAASVGWTVVLNDPLTGVNYTDFALTGAGASGASITSVTGSGTTYTVTAATGNDGALGLNFINSVGLSLLPTNLPFAGPSYFVDKNPLTVGIASNLALVNDAKVGPSRLSFTATYSETMDTTSTPSFSFPTPGENPGGSFVLSSSSWTTPTTFVANYNVNDLNATIYNIDVRVSGGKDTGGNLFGSFTKADLIILDTENPIVTSITLGNPPLNSLPAETWSVKFNEPVTGLTAANFSLMNGGLSGTPAVSSVLGVGTDWNVAASGYAGQGTLALYVTGTAGVTDSSGNPLGALPVAGPAYSIDPIAPRVLQVQVNDGSAQRSRVTSVTVTFLEPVAFAGAPAAAFTLTGPNGPVTLAVDLSASSSIETVAKLTFSGSNAEYSSLKDGRYTLSILSSQVSDLAGNPLDGNGDGAGGDNYNLVGAPGTAPNLFRLFGDINGDGTVDGVIDFPAFGAAFNVTAPNSPFDFNGDGIVEGAIDFPAFGARFNVSL